jgi:hypothetical protein
VQQREGAWLGGNQVVWDGQLGQFVQFGQFGQSDWTLGVGGIGGRSSRQQQVGPPQLCTLLSALCALRSAPCTLHSPFSALSPVPTSS